MNLGDFYGFLADINESFAGGTPRPLHRYFGDERNDFNDPYEDITDTETKTEQ